MEPLKSGDAPALVSNLEVMELIQERMATRQSDKFTDGTAVNSARGPFQQRDWIEQTVLEYLKSSPAGSSTVKMDELPKLVETLRREVPAAAAPADADATKSTKNENDDDSMRGYGLTTAETLQVLNHLPTSLVELHLLIEDLEKRIPDEEKQMDFLRLISQYSGREVEEAAGEEETDDMEE